MDTLCEGRLSFLEFSTFSKLLICSTPPISSIFGDFRSNPEVLLLVRFSLMLTTGYAGEGKKL